MKVACLLAFKRVADVTAGGALSISSQQIAAAMTEMRRSVSIGRLKPARLLSHETFERPDSYKLHQGSSMRGIGFARLALSASQACQCRLSVPSRRQCSTRQGKNSIFSRKRNILQTSLLNLICESALPVLTRQMQYGFGTERRSAGLWRLP